MSKLFKGKNLNNIIYFIAILLLISFSYLTHSKSIGSNNTEQNAVLYYIENYDTKATEDEITAELINYGCHREIHVFDKSELVLRLNYKFGKFSQIG